MRVAIVAIVFGLFAAVAGAQDVEIRKFAEIDAILTPGGSGPPAPTVLRQGAQRLTYALEIINHGPGTAMNIHVVDPLSSRLDFGTLSILGQQLCAAPLPGGQGTVTCDIPTLAAGQSRSFFFSVFLRNDALSFQPLVNTATVTSSTPDSNLTNNTATVSLDVEANVPVSREALLAIALAIAAIAFRKLAR